MKFFFALILSSCASNFSITQLKNDEVVTAPVKGIEQIRVNTMKIESEKDAQAMVVNRHDYFKEMFTQSIEPYFGGNHWSKECIKGNKIKDVRMTSQGMSFRANMTADQSLKPGFYAIENIKVLYLVGQCNEDSTFYEVSMVGPHWAKFVCPDKLFYK